MRKCSASTNCKWISIPPTEWNPAHKSIREYNIQTNTDQRSDSTLPRTWIWTWQIQLFIQKNDDNNNLSSFIYHAISSPGIEYFNLSHSWHRILIYSSTYLLSKERYDLWVLHTHIYQPTVRIELMTFPLRQMSESLCDNCGVLLCALFWYIISSVCCAHLLLMRQILFRCLDCTFQHIRARAALAMK